jgi:hypothetical protein
MWLMDCNATSTQSMYRVNKKAIADLERTVMAFLFTLEFYESTLN